MNCLLSRGHFAGQRQHTELFICGLVAGKCVWSLAVQLWPNETNSARLSSVKTLIWVFLPKLHI